MKKCQKCKQSKDESEFYKRKKSRDGVGKICKGCSNENSKKYYRLNREKHKREVYKRNVKVIERNKSRVNDIKRRLGCCVSSCLVHEPSCLDLHHIDMDKREKEVSIIVGSAYGWSKIEKELSKCAVICANHHRMLHAGLLTLTEEESKPITICGIWGE